MTDQDSNLDPRESQVGWWSPFGWFGDLELMLGHMTRLPARAAGRTGFSERLPRALRVVPVVGLIVGAIGGFVYGVAIWFDLPPFIAATLAVVSTAVASGAYHEDGLADTADGFGGSYEREQKLAIMSDSRHGSFGVLALVASFLLRIGALAAIAEPGFVFAALVTAHAVSRATMPAVMRWCPPAKREGQGFDAGKPEANAVWVAIAIAAVIALVGLGVAAFPAVLATIIAAGIAVAIAQRQVGGYTGDVLGAVQQVSEIAMLLALVALSP